jgi:hypothetical protein
MFMKKLLVKTAFLICLITLIISVGCSSTNSVLASPVPPPTSSTPDVGILSPADGASVTGDFMVSVFIYNFILKDPSVKKNAQGEGHFEFCIYPSSSTPTPSNIFGGECSLTSAIYSITTLTQPGTYTISAELKNMDDTSFNPPIKDTSTVVISGQGNHKVSLLLNLQYYTGGEGGQLDTGS